jgi:hypothetical protein
MARRNIYDQVAALRKKHKGDRSLVRGFPDLSVRRTAPSLSDGFAKITDNRARSITDKFRHEDQATRAAIQAKADQVRPTYSKGPYQLATESDSAVGIYRK